MHARAWTSAAAAALLLSQALLISSVKAITPVTPTFPDVGMGSPYIDAIEALAARGIVRGNPDGTFKPGNTVNRAEMLTLLYRAQDKTPGAPAASCFRDVAHGSWYEAVVCDAATRGYVGGYPDGTFKPEKAVNRVESLKMINTVFGFDVNANVSFAPLGAYSDLSPTGWYAPYVARAFERGVLPTATMRPPLFGPDGALSRGEAAAYIANALGLTGNEAESSAAASAESSASSAAQQQQTSSVARSSAGATENTVSVDFPFGDTATLQGSQPNVYVFSFKTTATGLFRVTADREGVNCRLYKVSGTSTAFALEYYLGHVVDKVCTVRATLGAGDWQFEVFGVKNMNVTVFTNKVSGDGNDGFNNASTLVKGTPKTSSLDLDDVADWFKFTIPQVENLTVEVAGTDNLRCLIYPMEDVDLYGFSGPTCNAAYEFPQGTYYVGVQRRDGRNGKESFSVRFRP